MASESRWSRSSGFALHTGRDAREKTMPVLRLILDPEGAAFDVNDAMLIGVCAAQLASQLGYPLLDSAGMAVNYQLRLNTRGRLLPNDRRLSDLHLASGARFSLVSATTSAPTRPMYAFRLSTPTQSAPPPPPRAYPRAFHFTRNPA